MANPKKNGRIGKAFDLLLKEIAKTVVRKPTMEIGDCEYIWIEDAHSPAPRPSTLPGAKDYIVVDLSFQASIYGTLPTTH
jgi:hypothetical protein